MTLVCVVPVEQFRARRAAPRGLLLSAGALALCLVAAVSVLLSGDGRAQPAPASLSEKLLAVRTTNKLRAALAGGAAANAKDVAAAAAAVATNAAAHLKKASSEPADSGSAEPVTMPGFLISTPDDSSPAEQRSVAKTSKLVMGPEAFEAALVRKYKAAHSPLHKLARTPAARLHPSSMPSKTSTLDMADEGDKDLAVAATVKETVGDKSAEGANLTTSTSPFPSPDDMKAIEQVQAAVKAAADAEVDEAVATSKAAATASYADSRKHFLAKEAANNVTGALTYSASNEIYHDSNKWVKELKSLKLGGQLLSERPERSFTVVVPSGVVPGHQFVAQVPGSGEMLVRVPAGVVAGQTIAIEVPAAVSPAKSVESELGRRAMVAHEMVHKAQELAKTPVKEPTEAQYASKLEKAFLKAKAKLESEDDASKSLAARLAAKERGVEEGAAVRLVVGTFTEGKTKLHVGASTSAPGKSKPEAQATQLRKSEDKILKIGNKILSEDNKIHAQRAPPADWGSAAAIEKRFLDDKKRLEQDAVASGPGASTAREGGGTAKKHHIESVSAQVKEEDKALETRFLRAKKQFENMEMKKEAEKNKGETADGTQREAKAAKDVPEAMRRRRAKAETRIAQHSDAAGHAEESVESLHRRFMHDKAQFETSMSESQTAAAGKELRDEMATRKELQDERAHARRHVLRGAMRKAAAAKQASVATAASASSYDSDADVAAAKPAAVGLDDGDEMWRGEAGVVGAASVVAPGYWGSGGAYYGVTVPAGLKGGQDFLAKIPNGPEMLVTVPTGVGPGSHIAIIEPREQSLAFGDAAHFKDSAAAEREGGVRHGVRPDFVKPLGDLGETGLYEKKAGLEARWLQKEGDMRGAIAVQTRPPQVKAGTFTEIKAARKKDGLAAVLAKSEAWAARKAEELHPAHDMFDEDEEMRAAGVRHSDGGDWMSMKAARTQSLLSKDVGVSKGKAQTVPQEIATEKRKAEELEQEWVRKKVSQATAKSKVDAAMALLHAEQDSKVRQAIDIVHAADHAVRFASTIGLEKPAKASLPGAARGAGSMASPSKAKANKSQKARTLEADVDSLAHQVLAKIAEERVEMGGGKSGRNEQLAAAAASASTAHRTEHVTDDIAMAAYKENEKLEKQAKLQQAMDLISSPAHVRFQGDRV